jgi:hypothetical protein
VVFAIKNISHYLSASRYNFNGAITGGQLGFQLGRRDKYFLGIYVEVVNRCADHARSLSLGRRANYI